MPEDEVIKLLCRGCGHKTDARRLGTDTDGNEVYDGLTIARPSPTSEDYLRACKQCHDMTEEAEKWRHKAIIAEDNYRRRLADFAGLRTPGDRPPLWRRIARALTRDLQPAPTNGASKENSK